MDVLDEQGRLFGRVNVVDAVVVLFALAVVVAGLALVVGDPTDRDQPDPTPDGDPDEPPARTMYVTVVTGGQPATALSTGEVTVEGRPANVTDVHRTPGPRTYLRLELNGTDTEDGFRYGGNPVRLGDGLTVTAEPVRTGVRVTERDTDPRFETATTSVTLAGTVRTPIADAVAPSDRQRVGDATVATVTAVDRSAVNGSYTDFEVTLDLHTRLVDGTPHYAGGPVRLGRTLGVTTDTYRIHGVVVARE